MRYRNRRTVLIHRSCGLHGARTIGRASRFSGIKHLRLSIRKGPEREAVSQICGIPFQGCLLILVESCPTRKQSTGRENVNIPRRLHQQNAMIRGPAGRFRCTVTQGGV